jgi:two-component system phosphate regulon sensor histidine kinase PhoR
MMRRRFFWYLYPPLLAMVLVSLAVVMVYAIVSIRSFHLSQTERELSARARVAAMYLAPLLSADSSVALDTMCHRIGRETDTRITVVLRDGRVIADSWEKPLTMDNHADRPEVREVLQGKKSSVSVRFSSTLRRDLVYVAVPMRGQSGLAAVVRASMPLRSVATALRPELAGLLATGLLVVLAAAGVCLGLARSISRPVEELTAGAERFARGELARTLATPNSEELARLAATMNAMASQLGQRIEALTQQKSEQEAVLSCMIEGVVAVDADLRVLTLNAAAMSMLGVSAPDTRGRALPEVVRHSAVNEFVRKALLLEPGATAADRAVIAAHNGPERTVELHGAVLAGAGGRTLGALAVLHDVTRAQRLDDMRRDFVANVSHELRTPLTSIQGFVETLQHVDSAEKRSRFLGIIANHASRLGAIVEDLLALSNIEQDELRHDLPLEPVRLPMVLSEAATVCESIARQRGVRVEVMCADDLTVPANAFLLEQAVINLIDNAVKYGGENATVTVQASATSTEARITVHDAGPGIPPEHLDRIFERFYRIDKARSRKLGGTGLGLSIVKHIMRLHGGDATVESAVGAGSTFTLHLPISA